MRVLVTGGAGFIGSHVLTTLAARGHDPVVLDALLPSAHPTAPQPPAAAADWIHADVRDRVVLARALHGVDAVRHQAAMVGLGKDFADAPAYVSCNDFGTAVLLASTQVHPGPPAAADLDAGRFEPSCRDCGAELVPGLVDEDAPPDRRKVYQTRPGASDSRLGAGDRRAGRLAALSQRVRAGDAA